jgi:hypothetical protein
MQSQWESYVIPQALEEEITDAYVKRGEQGALFDEKAGAGDLARVLSVARGLTLSYGSSELGVEVFERACGMEKERRARVGDKKA